jgi:hypothetical protein
MLTKWQFNILFFVGVGGAILLLLGPEFGLDVATNPTAVTGVGAILTYVLTQKKLLTRNDSKTEDKKKEVEDGDV